MVREGGAGPAPRPGPAQPRARSGAGRAARAGAERSGAEAERCDVHDVVQGEPGASRGEGRGDAPLGSRFALVMPAARAVLCRIRGFGD